MSLLDRKLVRDLGAMRGQVATIALVVATGVAVFVSSVSTYDSLLAARARFYVNNRFPDLFVTVKRAPLSAARQLADTPGVTAVEPRIVRDVIVDWPAAPIPISARMISISNGGAEQLASLYLRRGSYLDSDDTKGVLINEAFAQANGIAPGSDIRVLLNGKIETLKIRGIVLSPEYVYAVKPGMPIPDDRFYAILWMDRSALEAAFALDGAFNDAVATLAPEANPRAVIAEFDRLLEPYGTFGAVERRDQASHRFLDDELTQQRVMATTVPYIFFAIAAFLLNGVLARLVAAQREQIAALKALGFPTGPILAHYLKLVALVVLLGSALGIGAGTVFGEATIASYRGFFRFPELPFALTPWSAVAAAAISLAAASAGATTALRSVVALSPAVAMRPAAPRRLGFVGIERVLPARLLRPRRVMILRSLAGRPLRAIFTVLAIAFAVPTVVMGLFWRDAVDRMMEIQFGLVDRANVTLTFLQPVDADVVNELRRMPGVMAAEGQRIVPVRLRAGHRTYLTSVIGLPSGGVLRRPRDTALRTIEPPPQGITLARQLARRLDIAPGETLTVEVLEGRRRKQSLVLAATVDEMLGMSAYMRIDAINRLTGEGDVVSAAALFAEPSAVEAVSRELKELPTIEAVSMKSYTMRSFLDKVAALVLVTAAILTGFGVIIAVGVVYNSARIALQERAWELASLRVLGFTRAEVSGLLFAEFAVEIVVALPLGFLLSQAIIDLLVRAFSNESFQVPAFIEARTFAAAAIVVMAAAVASAYAVRRRIDRLDLVAVLKTRD